MRTRRRPVPGSLDDASDANVRPAESVTVAALCTLAYVPASVEAWDMPPDVDAIRNAALSRSSPNKVRASASARDSPALGSGIGAQSPPAPESSALPVTIRALLPPAIDPTVARSDGLKNPRLPAPRPPCGHGELVD